MKDSKGQLILLAGMLIILSFITLTALMNGLIFTSNLPSTGLEKSKFEIRDIREHTIQEMNYASLATINYSLTLSDPTNETLLESYFLNYTKSFTQNMQDFYATKGVYVNINVTNVTFNESNATTTLLQYTIKKERHTFPNGSLIIPMDSNQTNLIKTYGFIWRLIDSDGSISDNPLNNTSIPVSVILQNPVSSNRTDFYSNMTTDDNATSTTGTVAYRSYSGGPFMIDRNNFNDSQLMDIYNLSQSMGVTLHALNQSSYTWDYVATMYNPPDIALYPPDKEYASKLSIMTTYYSDAGIPNTEYTIISDTMILNDELDNFSVMTAPHAELDTVPDNVIAKIITWTSNGGIIHIECAGLDSIDDRVEEVDGANHTWYGFIGINATYDKYFDKKNASYPGINEPHIRLVDTLSEGGIFAVQNLSVGIPYNDTLDAPYNPLTQSNHTDGIFGPNGGSTRAFTLNSTPGAVNPGVKILGIASYANGTPLYFDSDNDGISEYQLTYVEAPFDSGKVIYLAGHNLTERDGIAGAAERLIFETFFAAAMTKQTIYAASTVDFSITYRDGRVNYQTNLSVTL